MKKTISAKRVLKELTSRYNENSKAQAYFEAKYAETGNFQYAVKALERESASDAIEEVIGELFEMDDYEEHGTTANYDCCTISYQVIEPTEA